jgi:hypothetical protein
MSSMENTTNIFNQQMDKEGPVTMEEAAGFFANVFGGERFVEYVRLLQLYSVAFSLLILEPI